MPELCGQCSEVAWDGVMDAHGIPFGVLILCLFSVFYCFAFMSS
jgi:hypothetical protein